MVEQSHPDRHGLIIGVPPYGAPELDDSVWLAPGSVVVGDVQIGADSSVWYNAVIRGDSDAVRIGARTNLQDGVVVHTLKGAPTVIEDDVSVGHSAVVHGAHVHRGCLIGMNATVLSGAVVGEGSLVAAGALVPQGMQIPPRSLVAGVPARVVRELREDDREAVRRNAELYAGYTVAHRDATRG
ncbi:carbonic anhydrase/acetyltransferase-like protein (isoleucine patch superfamily) [Leucobacter exalbidus]|uniref:Carbonic anhydrase/acetyltransferase-like protein (Isoleucine patch superfamily) n=1 Tax=Leucobacter exalbidus TaxID=662960 RepID=A0A940SZV8_9MICO|nr:gamma carbonic anhydrase family protein [Leucobacter exalbidus]MBP1325290.1 carbonic anhydrase/acetyltransferase-like protein (isoleucine patch superfamily) [Leucobacter exalbidus]